jgi:hypothetical protein
MKTQRIQRGIYQVILDGMMFSLELSECGLWDVYVNPLDKPWKREWINDYCTLNAARSAIAEYMGYC